MRKFSRSFPILVVLAICLVSCERNFDSEIINQTPPALEVVVRNAANAAVPNATVKLYKDEPTWNTEGTPVTTKQTNTEGRVIFSKDDLKDPGFAYLITSGGALTVKSKTKYLLLNDGVTLFTVSLR